MAIALVIEGLNQVPDTVIASWEQTQSPYAPRCRARILASRLGTVSEQKLRPPF